jgi:hypothetical protein
MIPYGRDLVGESQVVDLLPSEAVNGTTLEIETLAPVRRELIEFVNNVPNTQLNLFLLMPTENAQHVSLGMIAREGTTSFWAQDGAFIVAAPATKNEPDYTGVPWADAQEVWPHHVHFGDDRDAGRGYGTIHFKSSDALPPADVVLFSTSVATPVSFEV